MTPTLRFAGLDLRVLQTTARSILGVSALLALLTWTTAPTPPMMVAVFLLAAGILAIEPFRADERGHLDALYATLPITRRHVVAGRYLTVLLITAACAVAGIVVGTAAAAVRGDDLQLDAIGIMLLAGLAINAVILAIEVPILFSVGYTRARWVTLTPILLVCLTVLVAQTTGLNLTDLVGLFQQPAPIWLLITSPIASLGVLALSALLATHQYAKRDI